MLSPAGPLFAGSGEPTLLSDLDIPLMEGFHEEADGRVIFDTPEGRIVEVRASGLWGAVRVFDYYRQVLPSLAWRIADEKINNCDRQILFCLRARRDGEILTVKIRQIKQPRQKTVIYFSLNPE